MLTVFLTISAMVAAVFLIANQASISVWTISYGLFALLATQYSFSNILLSAVLWIIFALLLIGALKPLRRKLVSQYLLKIAREFIPSISATEREALEAGKVGWEGQLFSGSPDFNQLRLTPEAKLTRDEQAFIDGPVNELCRMVDDWEITHNQADLPPEVWAYIKSKGFWGMIIPKAYGGLEFSATAQISILSRLYGRSITLATTVAVPNSLGPAELLLKYGTQAQREYYLPRLAKGEEIPCFALTNPSAGSDAASIPDAGVVCRKTINGKDTLGIRLNWNKRYITLCPVATIIGLAFRLFDPENLLGKGHDIGISCALIPADTPGISRGRRHYPLNNPFMNGPTQGKNVFIPMDYLIGGAKMAGQGWQMLMECLSAGRAISLPSSALGGSQAAVLAAGAYSRIRKQFNQPIGKFEGIEQALARIAGKTYMIDAALFMTATAREKSAIAGAILKYHTTEWSRQIAIDTMDIHGGKGICLGPKNYIGRGYEGAPIGITVEGANILTRNLIIFGQGAIRCHPYVFKEMESIRKNNLMDFDNLFWSHTAFFLANFTKSFLFSFTDGRFTSVPEGKTKRHYQLIRRYSSNLSFLSDFAMFTLGAKLKVKEAISARLGDILSYLYMASAVLEQHYKRGEPQEELALVEWSCQYLFEKVEKTIQSIIANYPIRWARIPLKVILQPLGLQRYKPSDLLCKKLAKLLITPNDTRRWLTRLVFQEPLGSCPLGKLEEVFHKVHAVEELEKNLTKAVREGRILSLSILDQINEAYTLGIINKEEAAQLHDIELARQDVIAVDDFDSEDLTCKPNKEKKDKKEKKSVEIKAPANLI